MSISRRAAVLCALCLSITASAGAQFMHRGPQAPKMPTPFHPVMGSGARYQMTTQEGTMNFTYAVVGKEQVEGNEGYWLEIRTERPQSEGEMIMKELMVMSTPHPEIKRMIVQPPGRPPMEMPLGMMGMMQQRSQPGQETGNGLGEKIGTESITVPAGTFECEHYRKQEEDKTVDFWVSTKVPPYGLVKMTSAGTSMVLEKVLSNETSHVKGEPQKMQMPNF